MAYNGDLLEEMDGYENFSSETLEFFKRIGVKSAKELPNWYGIPDVKFIYHNNWSDPEVFYNGKRYNPVETENTMWINWLYDENGNFVREREDDMDGFRSYMVNNRDMVIEYLIGGQS